MSFGLLKHFKEQNIGPHHYSEIAFTRHLILGNDLASILKLMELRKNVPVDEIKLICSRVVNKKLLIENYQYGLSQIRSEKLASEIYKKYFDAKMSPQKNKPQFYKDGKFHDFGGRAKPMELLEGEKFFLNPGYYLNISSLFVPEDWENLDQIINQHLELRILEGIEKTDPVDLVEKNEWLLSFKDFKKIKCENIYSALSPKNFLKLLKHTEKLTPSLVDFCSSVHIQGALSMTWQMKKEICSEERTFFIPQSMTHEWGHFIIEFENTPESYLCHGLFLTHEEEPQPEDLASKIKLMKRVIERVFPEFEKNIDKEIIRFDDEMFISNAKDFLLEQLSTEYSSLHFLGQAAPMKESLTDEKFLARVLLS